MSGEQEVRDRSARRKHRQHRAVKVFTQAVCRAFGRERIVAISKRCAGIACLHVTGKSRQNAFCQRHTFICHLFFHLPVCLSAPAHGGIGPRRTAAPRHGSQQVELTGVFTPVVRHTATYQNPAYGSICLIKRPHIGTAVHIAVAVEVTNRLRLESERNGKHPELGNHA